MEVWIHRVHSLIWGPGTLGLFLLAGIFFTIRFRGFQLMGIRQWWSATAGSLWNVTATTDFGGHKNKTHDFSQIQSACTALAATIGTGNIVGVATALTAGGAGALFWMWVSAVIGMMTAYAETALGMNYRYRDRQGQWLAGPMIYIEKGLSVKLPAVIYAVLCLLASLGMGSMVQSNSMTATLQYQFGISEAFPAILITGLVLAVLAGGVAQMAKVTERLIPWAAGIYIFFSLLILISCIDQLGGILAMVFRQAFSFRAAVGGTAGYGISTALRYGMARGVFSNEAGLGSLAVLHGNAQDPSPQRQGMWAMFEVFFDTIVICTMTGLVILCMTDGGKNYAGFDGAALTARCFAKRLGTIGEWLICGAMLVFAFATILAWYYAGRQVLLYLLDKFRWLPASLEFVYLVLYLAAVCYGGISSLDLVWELSDIWNGGMAVLNLAALLLLSRQIPEPGGNKK